jgi:hypothetical protein
VQGEHDHPAAREERPAHARANLRPQGPRGHPRAPHRAGAHEGRDPRALPEPDLLRPRPLRDRGGRPLLRRQGRARRLARRGRAARGRREGPRRLLAAREPRARDRAPGVRARPDEAEGLRLRGAGRRRERRAIARCRAAPSERPEAVAEPDPAPCRARPSAATRSRRSIPPSSRPPAPPSGRSSTPTRSATS